MSVEHTATILVHESGRIEDSTLDWVDETRFPLEDKIVCGLEISVVEIDGSKYVTSEFKGEGGWIEEQVLRLKPITQNALGRASSFASE